MSEQIKIDRGYFAEQLGVAAKVERERIIKLLEAEGCQCTPDPEAGKCYPHNLIALIKGENK